MDRSTNNEAKVGLAKFLWRFYRPFKPYVVAFVIVSGMIGLRGLINSYLTKVMIDELTVGVVTLGPLIPIAIAIVLNFEVYNLGWRAIGYLNLKMGTAVRGEITSYLFEKVHQRPYRFFGENLSGSISNNILAVAETSDALSKILVQVIGGLVLLVASLLAMELVHPLFFLALLAWTAAFGALSFFYSHKIRRLSDEAAASASRVSGRIVDSVSNYSSVKVFCRHLYEQNHLQRLVRAFQKKVRSKEWFLLKFYFVQGSSITLLMAFIIYSLIRLHLKGLVTVGDFAFILGASVYVTENVWRLTQQFDLLNDAVGRCNQSLRALLGPERPDGRREDRMRVREPSISFENLTFHYEEGQPLFEQLSLEIGAGQKVGLVGPSGGGKSTFVNLILGLYNPQAGRVLIDGQDIQEVTEEALRRVIGMIPQECALFHRSLLENIRYGRVDATDLEVMEVARLAHVDEFAHALSNGYQTTLGERGIKLSGGERQRIAIARALLKQAPILIMDEATSQLDSLTERTISGQLASFMSGRTTIVIAHRLSTLQQMDRLLVFDRGQIVEDGTHEQLLAREGLYAALWNAQVDQRASSDLLSPHV